MKSGKMKAVLAIGAAMFLAACGSGGGGGGGTAPAATATTGTFVDSTVDGLHYSTTSNPTGGFTSGGGRFQCHSGDQVTFDLGGQVIGSPQTCSSNPVTAVSVFGGVASTITDNHVVNLSRLLLTLGCPTGTCTVISLPQALPPLGTLDFSVSPVTFAANIQAAGGPVLISLGTVTTHLAQNFNTLSVTLVHSGLVTSNPAGISCTAGTCSFSFQTGTGVTLTATGSGFTGWSLGSCVGTGPCAITLNADTAVTATFPVTPPPATLTISPSGTGTGTVTCSVNGGASFGACAPSYPNATALVLQGVANNGSFFAGWSNGTGNATVCPTTAVNCSLTLTANSAVTATFNAIVPLPVTGNTATSNGGGGTVQCSANGAAPGPCTNYPPGTPISMTASPNSVSNFTAWNNASGSATTCNASSNPVCTFTLTASTSITANFKRPTLTVVVAGTGTGTVNSNPGGITNCTTNCAADFNKGTPITLTATGAGFTGWNGGGCSGTAPCPVTLNVDTMVTANFGQVTTSSRWLFYTDTAGTIRYADPANPGATTTTLTTTAAASDLMLVAAWDSTNAAYTNLTASHVTYFSGGKVWRVSATKSSGVPGSGSNLPVQISSETAATTVCDEHEVGAASATSIKLFYELPGADGNCATQNDNVTKWVRVLDDATTSPSALAPGLVLTGLSSSGNGVSWVTDLSTGLPTHILLLDAANSNTLQLMNVTTNVITTIQANVGKVRFLVQDTSNRVFLRGGANNNILYLYTVTTNALIPLVTSGSQLRHGKPMGDGTNLYVAESANGKLYKVPMNATVPGDVVTLLSSVGFPLGAGGDGDLVVTTSNVFLHTYVPCSGGCIPPDPLQDAHGLYRVSKSGGSATPIIAHATGTKISNVLSSKGLLYYNHLLPSGVPQANIIKEDGTSVFASPASCFPCAGWTAAIASPTFFVRSNDLPLSKVLLFALANLTGNGAMLTAFDAPTGTQGANLGTVPVTTPALDPGVGGADFLDTVALLVGKQNGSANTFVFFVDAALAGSLTQVPTGTAGSWIPVGF